MCGCERHWDCRAACVCNCFHRDSDCQKREEHPGQRHVYEDGMEPPKPWPQEKKVQFRKDWDNRVKSGIALPDGVLS